MAGDWIKVESTTPDKPEVLMISEYLDISPETALGHLIRFWIWVDYQQQNCNGLSVTKKSIDRITRMQNFADAMINCGWLIEDESNLSIPNFDFHNGNTAKTRATTYKRVKTHRNKSNDNVTVQPLQNNDIRVTREEKRRDINNIKEINKEKIPKHRISLPDSFYPDETGIRKASLAKLALKETLDGFRDHHKAKGSLMLDWQAAWRTWVRNAVRFAKPGAQKPEKFHPSRYINRNYERDDDDRIIEG